MSAPVDVLAVLRQVSPSVPNEHFIAFDDAARDVAELLAAAEHFARGMPLSLADNTAVIGGVNAQALERLRSAIKAAKGVQP